MRLPSVLFALLLVHSETSGALAFSFSPDDVLHWFLNRGIQPAVVHTESTIALGGYIPLPTPSTPTTIPAEAPATPSWPSSSIATPTNHGPRPGVAHTEESIGISPYTGGEGSSPETTYREQTTPRPTPPASPPSDVPPDTTSQTSITVAPIAHTESAVATPWTPFPSAPDQGSRGSSSAGGVVSGASSSEESSSGGSGSNSVAPPPGDDESSSGNASPDIGAPGWSSAPAAVISSASVTVGTGSSSPSAPVSTAVPTPGPASVTMTWTEGGNVVTGVFAAPTGTEASSSNTVPILTASAQQASATAASEEASTSAAGTANIVSGMTTSVVASPSGTSDSGSASAPTGAASRSLNAVTGSLVAAIAALMLML